MESVGEPREPEGEEAAASPPIFYLFRFGDEDRETPPAPAKPLAAEAGVQRGSAAAGSGSLEERAALMEERQALLEERVAVLETREYGREAPAARAEPAPPVQELRARILAFLSEGTERRTPEIIHECGADKAKVNKELHEMLKADPPKVERVKESPPTWRLLRTVPARAPAPDPRLPQAAAACPTSRSRPSTADPGPEPTKAKGEEEVAAAPSEAAAASLEEELLRLLPQAPAAGMDALALRGKLATPPPPKEVNRVLYALAERGIVEVHKKDGGKPRWSRRGALLP